MKPTTTYWGFPGTPEDMKWQEWQQKIWIVPGFLVQNRFDRRKRLLSAEHSQILVALNKCAPPKIISNMLAAGRKYIVQGDAANKILFLLISRQYPLYLFQWFLEVISKDFVKEQRDATGCGVVAAQFRFGCIKPTEHTRDSFAVVMTRLALANKNGEDFVQTPQYTEWLEKLRLFINLWATNFLEGQGAGNTDDLCAKKFILHNALMNPDSPPLLLQLLAKVHPMSVLMNHPKTTALPIHFACRQWQFQDYPLRKGEKIVKVGQVCAEFLKADLTQTRNRHRGRLPLHHAIAYGKSWDFIKPLVTNDLKSLLLRDPTTMLRPFQMAALKIQQTFDVEALARREYTPIVWKEMTDEERDRQMRKLLFYFGLKQQDLIFELLRHSPDAVEKITAHKGIASVEKKKLTAEEQLARDNLISMTIAKMTRTLFGLGRVQGHFIGWGYTRDKEKVWKVHRNNFPMLKEAIMDGFVPAGMDKWWRKLQVWLWHECPWNNIPRRTDFLLHCALCNPKVSPWIIELILECFPRSATLPLPGTSGCYPLHIACITDTYVPLPFEFANKRSVLEMVSKVYDESILLKWENTLPLHYAIYGSKRWSEMRSIAEDEPVSLAIPDSANDFFPFQLMALQKSYSKSEMQRFLNIAMIKTGKDIWVKSSLDGKVEQLKQVLKAHEINTLGCIFELLKRNPMLVHIGNVDSKKGTNYRSGGIRSKAKNERAGELPIDECLHILESNPSSVDLDFLCDT